MEQKDPIHDDLIKSDKISGILKKSIDGEKLTDAEQQTLNKWLAASPYNRNVYEEVMNPDTLEKDMKSMVGVDKEALWARIKAGVQPDKPGILSFFHTRAGRYAAAVAAVLVIATGVYFVLNKQSSPPAQPIASQDNQQSGNADLQPGRDRAVLQMENGQTILLDETANGLLSKHNDIKISKDGGELNYTSTDFNSATIAVKHTLKVPRNGKWTLDLSDGTRVILNSESSITYPVPFTGNTRDVSLSGEAFFEVAKDAKHPFRVSVKGMTIEVLGTHFNVNAYGDEEPIQTTLIEGSVKVTSGTEQQLLKPGQQSVLTSNHKLYLNPSVDIDKVLSWKENTFHFQQDDIETIMQQLARWYDVEIVYDGKKPTTRYTAQISRDRKVSMVFKALEASGGAKFRVDGRKIIVTALP